MENSSNKYIQVGGGFVALVFGILQGIDWLFNRYEIDSFYFNIILIILITVFIISVVIYFLKKKQSKIKNKSISKKSRLKSITVIVLSISILLVFLYFFKKIKSNENFVNQVIPEIIELYDSGQIGKAFLKSKALFEEYPSNEIIENYFKKSSRYAYLKTDTSGVDVSVQYAEDSIYNYIGQTPIDSFLVPNTWPSHKLKLTYNKIDFVKEWSDNHNYRFPDKTIFIPDGHKVILGSDPWMFLQGVNFEGIKLNSFSISNNEVSNKEYQKFVDSGGYENQRYWDFPFQVGDKIYDFNSSIKLFVDKYGKLGPSNWSFGKYPTGLGNHPVTGISWFEARAFARFSNLSLPNIYQWLYASGIPDNWSVVDLSVTKGSNYNSTQTREVDNKNGSYNGLNNIGGNVKEWTLNPNGDNKDKYSILGGSFKEAPYTFNNYYSKSPFDRDIGNGIRLSKNLTKNKSKLDNDVIPEFQRDFDKIDDVSDEVFEVYKSQFEYNEPLVAKTINLDNFQEGYTAQKFEIETAYESDEKLHGYIVFSNKFKGKYDPVIVYPNAGSIGNNTDSDFPGFSGLKHLVDEGYAIIHPIYYNTFSREKTINTFWANESEDYKNTIIKIGKDYKKSLDYIESRNDFNFDSMSYFGYSWGSTTSNYLLAIDDRIKSAVLCVGGLMIQKSKKEIEAHYYVRRIKTPILHIVGKEDGIFGYEENYKPWKKLIGTSSEKLKTIELENVGHGLPWDTIIKHQSNWIKRHSIKLLKP
ncbi:SUMF1/EgtB/PvdO family nonheme iron enzyme [Flavobacteriaceae bacterium]|nr:SUMF1/EgtB/PvdO family nonheme iron enzyme [Flavobacteriaceae bacterium]